jgi:hypothetical protein
MNLDELLQAHRHLLLDDARVVHMARDGEKLCPRVVLPPETGEPRAATTEDLWCHRDGLDVGDGGGTTEDANGGWEGRLEAWFAHLAFEGLNEACLLATNVSTGTAVEVDIKGHPGATSILADVATGIGLLDSSLKDLGLVDELATDVNVSADSSHGCPGDKATLNETMRIGSHDLTILAGTWLGLIGIHDEIRWTTVRLLRHEGPLETGRETSTTPTTKARLLNLIDDPIGTHLDHFLGLVPDAPLQSPFQVRILLAVNVGEDTVLVREPTVALCGSRGFDRKSTSLCSAGTESPPRGST